MSNQNSQILSSSKPLQHQQQQRQQQQQQRTPPRYSPAFRSSIHDSDRSSSVHGTCNGSSKFVNGTINGQSQPSVDITVTMTPHGETQRLAEEAAKKHLPLRKRIGSLPKKKAWIPPSSIPLVASSSSSSSSNTISNYSGTPSSLPSQQLQHQSPLTTAATTERKISYPPTPTSSHDMQAADYYNTSSIYSNGDGRKRKSEENITKYSYKEKKPLDRTTTHHPLEYKQQKTEQQQRRISMPLLSQHPIPKSNITTPAPMSSIPPKMKPLKKVQHWIIKGKMNGSSTSSSSSTTTTTVLPPKNGLVTPSEERFNNNKERLPNSRKLSWAEDDRPAPKKNKRGRPPSRQSRPSFLSDAATVKQRPGESIVATAMAAAKGSRRNSIRQQNGGSSNTPAANSNDKDNIAGSSISYPPDEILYCICRKPYDIPRFMIACDRCDQWFHGECIGISEKEGEFIDLYFCDDCSKATGKSTSWKPKCSNPACQRAARIGSHQGHVSKYCSNTCGMQVARARLELADIKRKAGGCATTTDITDIVARREKKARLESLSDKDDQKRLLRLREAKRRIKQEIITADRKLAFLKALINNNNDNSNQAIPCCGFDSRLLWPDDIWHSVCNDTFSKSENDGLIITKFSTPKSKQEDFSVCSEIKCSRHSGWQNLKMQEFEQDRSALFSSLATFVQQRKQIKARIRRRREGALEDTAEWLAHATITHNTNKGFKK